ncbi:acyl-CoA-like ligand-binding transcription factor [Streptomyces tendae]
MAPGAPPAGVLKAVLDAVGVFFPQEHRSTSAARATVIATNAELRERELLKSAELADAVESAVREQGRGEVVARFLATLALLALDTAHRRWIADPDGRTYGEHAHETLDELVVQASELPGPRARKG